ncbi:MAG: GTP-binding protein, partial [Ignavibacteria bacterium]|nr:GTP-binding protein [Ignavibacteria bacterium]
TEIPGTTRDSLDSNLKYHGQEILLVDTAGLRRKSKINESLEFYSVLRTLKAIDRCNVAIILLDATQGLEHQDMKILTEAVKRKRGIIICVNKWDLIEKNEKTARHFELALKEQLGEYDYIPVIFISCLTKQRIYKVIELSLKIFDNLNKKISTSEFNQFLEEVLNNFSLPSTPTGREVKIKYGLQVKSNPPVFAFFTNEPKHIQENTKKFLEKRIREKFGFEGVPITLIFKLK